MTALDDILATLERNRDAIAAMEQNLRGVNGRWGRTVLMRNAHTAGATMDQIADATGLTRQRVGQILRKQVTQ